MPIHRQGHILGLDLTGILISISHELMYRPLDYFNLLSQIPILITSLHFQIHHHLRRPQLINDIKSQLSVM